MTNFLEKQIAAQAAEAVVKKVSKKNVGRPSGSSRVKKPIGQKEFDILCAHISGADMRKPIKARWLKVVALQYYLGTRISEILLLDAADIRSAVANGESSLTNKTKTGKPRLLIFTPRSVNIIRSLFAQELDSAGGFNPTDLLFHSPRSRKDKLHPAPFTRQLNAIIHEALGPLYSTHSFRKGYITDLAEAGTDFKTIQHCVGHSNVSTTMSYFSPKQGDIRTALEAVR
jgi:integrase/recombinase XerD